MPRRRIIRRTMGKDPIKKALTFQSNVGPSTNPVFAFDIIDTANSRDPDGGSQTIRDSQTTGNSANVGDILKYVNIQIQAGPRDETPEDDNSGWLEWGIVKYKENRVVPTNVNLGVDTLPVVLTRAFRGDCLLTGNFPVGGDQPNSQDIVLKIPKVFTKMQIGSVLTLYCHFRSVNSASTSTTLTRLIVSAIYKLYV